MKPKEVLFIAVLASIESVVRGQSYTEDEYNIQLDLGSLNFSYVWIDLEFTPTKDERAQLFQAAVDCINMYDNGPDLMDDSRYCPITFDGWKCWNYTKSGTTAKQNCPSYIRASIEERISTKVCNPNGSWYENAESKRWTNYTDCVIQPLGTGYTTVYYVGYSLSSFCCSIALFIFCHFKSLSCPRVTMHKNLFLAFVLHGVTYTIHNVAIAGNTAVLTRDGFDCRLMLMTWQYFQMCGYFWMLCEGIYLHLVVVVAVLSNQNAAWWYYVIGWGLPMVSIAVYSMCRALLPVDKEEINDESKCWNNESALDWIIAVPMITVLVVNFLMLLNILRVLLSKLQHTHSSANSAYRRAVRATLILVPLLGLHYIIMPVHIKSEVFYSYFMAVCLSFQGVFVACIFCFFNAEVKAQILRRWFNYTANRKSRRRCARNNTFMQTSMTECTNTSITPQNARRFPHREMVQDPNRPTTGSVENSPSLRVDHVSNKDANSNTVDKLTGVDTPLIDMNSINDDVGQEPEIENGFKIGHVSRLDSGYCDVQIDTAV